jgi:hypothetical protein
MQTVELSVLRELKGRWIAVDTRRGYGRDAVVDFDSELDVLCSRLVGEGRRHLTIFFCSGQRETDHWIAQA